MSTGALATTITGSNNGADSITVVAAAGTGAITINEAGAGAKAIDLSGYAATGTETVTLGSGADTVKIGGGAATTVNITVGSGAAAITLSTAHTTGVDTITIGSGDLVQTAFDTVTNFNTAAANSDVLAFGSTTLLTSAQLGTGWTVATGVVTAAPTGATVATFLAAATTSTTAGVVAYIDTVGGNTWVVHSDGLASGAHDSVVELVGVTSATALAAAAGANTIHIA